jgi:hypothetical protein
MFFSRNDGVGLGQRMGWAVPSPAFARSQTGFAIGWNTGTLFLVMALAIVLLRLPFINFNVLNDDEAAYLMVGEALRHGAIPYVDIVDRKPLGIYLIYALAGMLFQDPVIGARCLGALCTFIAAVQLKSIGERAMGLSPVAGAVCGILYSTYALLFFGDAAQTPVFFMPLVIGAAALVIKDLKRLAEGEAPDVWRLGFAGLLLGLSLQVKYSTVIECGAWGVLPLFFAWRRRAALGARGLRTVLAGAGLMLVGGLLPTFVAYAVYVALGHADAFVFYNFTSNLTRGASQYSEGVILLRGSLFILAMAPLVIMSHRYIRTRRVQISGQSFLSYENCRWVHVVLVVWTVAALAAGLMQRQPFSHYFFDALAPLSLLAAAAVHWTSSRRVAMRTTAVLVALAVVGYVGIRVEKIFESGSPYLPQQVADDIRGQGLHSMYVFNASGLMYHLAHAPLPSRYPHPPMLTSNLEAASFQIDAQSELKKILGENPEAVVLRQPISKDISSDRRAIVMSKLADEYCLWRTYPAGVGHHIDLYLRGASCTRTMQVASAK